MLVPLYASFFFLVPIHSCCHSIDGFFMMLSFFMMSSRCSAERHLAGVHKQC